MQLKQIDLVNEIGGKSRVSEILNRKRKLTVDMIQKLTARLNLSPEVLINNYQLTREVRLVKAPGLNRVLAVSLWSTRQGVTFILS